MLRSPEGFELPERITAAVIETPSGPIAMPIMEPLQRVTFDESRTDPEQAVFWGLHHLCGEKDVLPPTIWEKFVELTALCHENLLAKHGEASSGQQATASAAPPAPAAADEQTVGEELDDPGKGDLDWSGKEC